MKNQSEGLLHIFVNTEKNYNISTESMTAGLG